MYIYISSNTEPSRKLPCSFGSCAETEFSKKIPAKKMKAYNFIIMFFAF